MGRDPQVLSEGINLSAASQGAQHQGGCGAGGLGASCKRGFDASMLAGAGPRRCSPHKLQAGCSVGEP